MGRKAIAAPTPDSAAVEAVSQTPAEMASQINAAREHQELVIAEFGDGLPWHPDHYEAAIRHELRNGFDALLRAGRYLLVARECAAHGEWAGMLARLNLDRPQASRLMEAARRIANVGTSQHLLAAAGNQSKLFELLTLDEGDFEALAEGEEVAGVTLDDVATMSFKELRAALREAREDLAAKDERLKKKEEQLERQDKNLRKVRKDFEKATPDEQLARLREACSGVTLQMRADISAYGEYMSLHTAIGALLDHDAEQMDFAAGLIGELFVELRKLRDQFGLPIVNDGPAE